MLRDEDTSSEIGEEFPDRLDSVRLKGCQACRSGRDRRMKVSRKLLEIRESNSYKSDVTLRCVTMFFLGLKSGFEVWRVIR